MKGHKVVIIVCFILGLVLYLSGLFLLFGASLNKLGMINFLFNNSVSSKTLSWMKLIGILIFMVGFLIFMISVVLIYKNNNIRENTKELIIEGKADVITLIVMTYLMIFMLVICLIFDQVIGALLFGITIFLQSVINSIMLKYFSIRS